MHMQWLDDVLVLLEERNMTRAAARRNITQPAFSRRIKGFESWLGVTVLERRANKVDISPALASNEAEIRTLVARLKDLQARIAQYDPARSTLSVAAQHATLYSIFPDLALRARHLYPALNFRLRTANLKDCASMFLKGETQMMLCYEHPNVGPLPFANTIRRERCSVDYLVPVVGGSLRYSVRDGKALDESTASLVYPEQSYFGEVLNASGRKFGTHSLSRNAVCETAFSSGIKEMALKGMGVAWLPFSMAHQEIESGKLSSLAETYGKEKLDIVVYAEAHHALSGDLLDLWSMKRA